MLNLPKGCEVNKIIPKNKFYEKANVSNSLKNEFVDKVERIIWKYKISEKNIGVTKTESTEEIQVFEVVLKVKIVPKEILNCIYKAIPYKILFILKYDDEFKYIIKRDDLFYYAEWDEDIDFKYNFSNLDEVYKHMIISIIHEDDAKEDFDEILDRKRQADILRKNIEILKSKLLKEIQFNKKVEMNLELKQLNNELEKLFKGE